MKGFEIIEGSDGDKVSFYLKDRSGDYEKIVKPILRQIKVGDSDRPIVGGDLNYSDKRHEIEYALDVLSDAGQDPYFVIGSKIAKGGVFINPPS